MESGAKENAGRVTSFIKQERVKENRFNKKPAGEMSVLHTDSNRKGKNKSGVYSTAK